MLPILISQSVPIHTIAKILAAKVLIAVISGFFAEWFYIKALGRTEKKMDIHAVCEEEKCHCEDGIFLSACKHTLRIFCYIFLISFVLTGAVELIGEDALARVFTAVPVVGEAAAALDGSDPKLCVFGCYHGTVRRRS